MMYLTLILYMLFYGQADNQLICLKTINRLTIDGKLDEKDWGRANSILIKDVFRKKSNNTMKVGLLWDNDNLYLSFQVDDKDLQAKQRIRDHPELSLDDMVEFLIDTRNTRDSCWSIDDVIYHINLLGQKKDDRGSADCTTNAEWNGSAKFAVKLSGTLNDSSDIDKGYVVEVSISWKELEVKAEPGFEMGVNFASGDSGKLFDWVGASPFRSPFTFGRLTLR